MRRVGGIDLGGVVFGVIVLAVGLYYFAQKTLGWDIPDLNWDQLWPLAVIALGVGIALSAMRRRGSAGQ
jgi:hypothetical protein